MKQINKTKAKVNYKTSRNDIHELFREHRPCSNIFPLIDRPFVPPRRTTGRFSRDRTHRLDESATIWHVEIRHKERKKEKEKQKSYNCPR